MAEVQWRQAGSMKEELEWKLLPFPPYKWGELAGLAFLYFLALGSWQ